MKLVIISGRSGSGKSTALNVLEDAGYYSIDNLPASLLTALVAEIRCSPSPEHEKLALCIDARSYKRCRHCCRSYPRTLRPRLFISMPTMRH